MTFAHFRSPARALIAAAAFAVASSVLANPDEAPVAGLYSNEEEVYFDALAKRPAAPKLFLQLSTADGKMQVASLDAFGAAVDGNIDASAISRISNDRINVRLPDGRTSELRRARPVSCWVAVLKDAPKADGSEDWHFQSNVLLHDQGGRASVGGGETGAQQVIVRVRNVTWDAGSTNKPVVTLYIHKPDKPERAESYSWAAPNSDRVGINLRWMQSGCSIDLADPSALTADKFKG